MKKTLNVLRRHTERRWLKLALPIGLLWLALSCNNDSTAPCRIYHVGAIEGHVLENGVVIDTIVGARAMEGSRRGRVVAKSRMDSTGLFRLSVTDGLYNIELNPGTGGIRISPTQTDTVRVWGGVRRFDLERGRVLASIGVPEEFNDRKIHWTLRGSTFEVKGITATADGGLVALDYRMVRPGPHTISFQQGGPITWLPGTRDRDRADTLEVTADSPTHYTCDIDAYAVLSGQITGSWQAAPTSPPRFKAYDADSSRVAFGYASDDGSFQVEVFDPVPVKICTENQGIFRWFGGDSFSTATLFQLQSGDRITSLSMVGSGVFCHLVGPGQIAHRNTAALLRDESGREFLANGSGSNPMAICNLAPGRYYLYIHHLCDHQDWANHWYDGVDDVAQATPINLAEGQLEELTVTMIVGGRIAGMVRDAAGDPVSSLRVGVFLDAETSLCGWLVFDHFENGIFEFSGLANGDYYLALRDGAHKWWYPGTADFDSATAVQIRDHEEVEGIEWTIPDD